MKWRYYQLRNDDAKASEQVFENLSMGAHKHTLSKKLLARFSKASGAALLIAFESLDLTADCLYKYGSYGGGRALREMPGHDSTVWTDSPRWGLIAFVDKYLVKAKEAVVVCENWAANRKHVTEFSEFQRESRLLLFDDEVYHVLGNEDHGRPESIECALRESEHHWAVGVCSVYGRLPTREIMSEEFFEVIVANTQHIFTPALDGEGYLVWSPKA